MAERLEEDLVKTSGVVIAHGALLTALLTSLQHKGLLDQAEVNHIVDMALVGVETAEGLHPGIRHIARKHLEGFAENMGGKVAPPKFKI